MATSVSRSSRALPSELAVVILRELRGHKATLLAASLVCKNWYWESAQYLFEVIRINTSKPHDDDWYRFLVNTPRIYKNVCTLRFVTPAEAPTVYRFDYLFQTMNLLPLLTRLELDRVGLSHGPAEASALAELRCKELSLESLTIENIPQEVELDEHWQSQCPSVFSYMLLLSTLNSVDRLRILSTRAWPQCQIPADTLTTLLPALALARPLRVRSVDLWCNGMSPLLAWLCGALFPGHTSPLDRAAVENFALTWIQPEPQASMFWKRVLPTLEEPTMWPPTLDFLNTLPRLRALDLRFNVCMFASAPKEPSFKLRSAINGIRLASPLLIERLRLGHLPSFPIGEYDVGHILPEGVHRLWADLMDVVSNTPRNVHTLELVFERYGGMKYEGRKVPPMTMYNWELLRRAIELHGGIKTVVFCLWRSSPIIAIACTEGQSSRAEGPASLWEGIWERHPEITTMLAAAVPGVRVEFTTAGWKDLCLCEDKTESI